MLILDYIDKMSCNDIHYIGKENIISIFHTYNISRQTRSIVGIRKTGKGRKEWREGVRQGVKDKSHREIEIVVPS
jgi:hypothetical protein